MEYRYVPVRRYLAFAGAAAIIAPNNLSLTTGESFPNVPGSDG